MTLVEFLTTRLEEAQARAWAIHDVTKCEALLYEEDMADVAVRTPHCDCGYPARVLREVESKRLFLADHEGVHRCDWGEHRGDEVLGWCTTLKRLALPYADHPEYNESWRV